MPAAPSDVADTVAMAQFLRELERWNIRREAFEEARLEREEEEDTARRLRTPSLSPALSASGAPKEPKVKEPDTFSGETPSKLNGFLLQCELMFSLHASRYESEEVKVSAMISYLRGSALQSVRPLVAIRPWPVELQSVAAFSRYLKSSFGDPDERGTAKRQLRGLRQTKSAAEHFAKVRELVAVAGFTDQVAIVDWAIHGLKPHLKDEIAKQGEFYSLAELVEFIVPLDNRLRHREEERKLEEAATARAERPKPEQAKSDLPGRRPWSERLNHPPPVTRVSEPRGEHLAEPKPDAFEASRLARNPDGTITEAERERRLREGSCLRCGQRGHSLATCPTAKPRPLPQIPHGGQAPKA